MVEWVLLQYRLPREPSTPRIAVWRRLRRLGVLQLGDGLVALPADARTREALDWVAHQVREAHGSAATWFARPTSRSQGERLEEELRAARAQEYAEVADAAALAARQPDPTARQRALRKGRADLRAIRRRDHLGCEEQEQASLAVEALTLLPSVAPR